MRLRRPCIAALLVLGMATAATAQPRPSFDYRAAKSAAEKRLCGSERLAARDRAIAAAYAQARRLHRGPRASAALLENQRQFLGSRDALAEANDTAGLADAMTAQRDHLFSIGPARTTLAGRWATPHGGMTISQQRDGRFKVAGSSGDARARWTCDVEASARPDASGALLLEIEDGWRLRLALDEGVLWVEEIPPANATGSAPNCGANGSMDGAYFPIRR